MYARMHTIGGHASASRPRWTLSQGSLPRHSIRGQHALPQSRSAQVNDGMHLWHELCSPTMWSVSGGAMPEPFGSELWFRTRIFVQGTAEEASACDRSPVSPLCHPSLSPLWKVLVLSDGSVTRHLQILTGSNVKVECLSMVNIGVSTEGLPAGTDAIQAPRVQRQVLLRAGHEQLPLVYASSWWNAEEVDMYLSDKSKPIWESLSQEHIELYREVQQVYLGHNAELEGLLQCKGPFWGRHYFFWHKQKPLTLIYEVFSNRIQDYLVSTDKA